MDRVNKIHRLPERTSSLRPALKDKREFSIQTLNKAVVNCSFLFTMFSDIDPYGNAEQGSPTNSITAHLTCIYEPYSLEKKGKPHTIAMVVSVAVIDARDL